MADQVNLGNLIEALSTAIIEAQDRIHEHQLSNIEKYFHEGGIPRTMPVKIPAHPDDEGALTMEVGDKTYTYVPHDIPLFVLAPTNQLKVREVKISFDVALSGLKGEEFEGEGGEGKRLPAKIDVDVRSGLFGKNRTARLKLTVEGEEPSEGSARLINHLLKYV